MKSPIFAVTLILCLAFSCLAVYRMTSHSARFNKSVGESLRTSAGYDQKFQGMVNRLEDILATRAEFGYGGNKDPMTGRRRVVVKPKKPPATKIPPKPTVKKPAVEAPDPVKLTAIIQDDNGNYTAIVMNGDRSLSVGKGEGVMDRTVTYISAEKIVMRDSDFIYTYDITGRKIKTRLKGTATPQPESSSE